MNWATNLPFSPHMASSDDSLFPNLKEELIRKKFGSNDEIAVLTNACFEHLDKFGRGQRIIELLRAVNLAQRGIETFFLSKRSVFYSKSNGLVDPPSYSSHTDDDQLWQTACSCTKDQQIFSRFHFQHFPTICGVEWHMNINHLPPSPHVTTNFSP